MRRDLRTPSRDGKQLVSRILTFYVKDLINDGDYARLETELLDVIRAERGLVLRARSPATTSASRNGGRGKRSSVGSVDA